MMIRAKLILCGIAAVLLLSCIPRPPAPDEADAQRAGTDLASLTKGFELYGANCSSCHNQVHPAACTLASWPPVIKVMAEMNKLSAADKELIQRYVLAVAQRPWPKGRPVQERECKSPESDAVVAGDAQVD